MVFIKHNSLKSDIFFNPIFIPGFSGSRFFRVQVFQGPGPRSGPGPGSASRVRGSGPGFRSSRNFMIRSTEAAKISVLKNFAF